jgi:hypothetical protein
LGVFSEDEDTDAKGKAEKVNENKTEEKPKLNSNQFIQLIGYIKTGKISIAQAVKKYNLTEEQKISLENIE